jgi:hypothetical protein
VHLASRLAIVMTHFISLVNANEFAGTTLLFNLV